mgnify:CR=1 FL=1
MQRELKLMVYLSVEHRKLRILNYLLDTHPMDILTKDLSVLKSKTGW